MTWHEDPDVRLLLGDACEQLRTLPARSVQCLVTSPPFWALRDYGTGTWEGGDPDCTHERPPSGGPKSGPLEGASKRDGNGGDGFYAGTCKRCGAVRTDGQIGLEETPEAWCAAVVAVMREAHRVLRDDGIAWVEVGDTYCSTAPGTRNTLDEKVGAGASERAVMRSATPEGMKPKDLVGAPWMLAFALRADGWFLRSDTIWARPNPMPESVTDRPTKAHSYVFLLSKRSAYFYDKQAIEEPHTPDGRRQTTIATVNGSQAHSNYENRHGAERWPGAGKNARSVWTIPTEATPFAHFATFPQALVEKCLKAGTSSHGCCSECGAPWQRVLERTPMEVRPTPRRAEWQAEDDHARTQLGGTVTKPATAVTTGWEPTCACGGIPGMPDGYELVASPTGGEREPDPSKLVGRAGWSRPRGENEGRRPITRYEQRTYAKLLRSSPHVDEMRDAAGEAFAHYVRTDLAGARPIPEPLLEAWIELGWLERVEVPERRPPAVVPCTVLDPFVGSGTTALVARRLGLHAVGIDLSEEYLEIAKDRLAQLSLFA